MRRAESRLSPQRIIMYVLGGIAVIWLALLIAPSMEDGIGRLIADFGEIMQHPFRITLVDGSLKTVLIMVLIYLAVLAVFVSSARNYRKREEHGSAKWGNASRLNSKYAAHKTEGNKILTQHVSIGMDGRKHMRNLNVLVCGGSGSGKTRFYAKPNIMNANTSYVVLDPKGELLNSTGCLLEHNGYTIKVIDLINMEKSHCYNPFVYLRNDNDIQRLVTNLFKNTTPKGAQTQDRSGTRRRPCCSSP